jgi:uncharacterized membrane protein YdjX (TVP38/TMEM64 family)
MTEALANFIQDAGWLAPIYYILSFVMTALLPFIPTPLVAALGGAAFGFLPATLYGILGMALGALVGLNLARRIGKPLVLRIVSPKAWSDWEAMVGIKRLWLWGVIFFVLNVDVAVIAAGLSPLPLRSLWVTAMIARFPWLLASAWFGEAVFVSDTVMYLALLGLVAGVVIFQKLRPRFRHWLVERVVQDGRDEGIGLPAASLVERFTTAWRRRRGG